MLYKNKCRSMQQCSLSECLLLLRSKQKYLKMKQIILSAFVLFEILLCINVVAGKDENGLSDPEVELRKLLL